MKYIIGADEVGYGAWAGPLVTCAVAVPDDWVPPVRIDDSKKLSPAQRARAYETLLQLPLRLSLVESSAIDAHGVRNALIAAHTAAIRAMMEAFPDAEAVLDGDMRLPELPSVHTLPRADGQYHAVMAASIIAKVNRDTLMQEYNKQYPGYAWDTNVGYGTADHQVGLARLGPCALHRMSYRPLHRYRQEAKA